MMLHRSTSSRRRRASRSVQGQPTPRDPAAAAAAARGRRASLASSEPASENLLPGSAGSDRQRSPRGSCVPNIALDADDEPHDEMFNRRLLPDPEQFGASRLSLVPDASRSPRGSLVPDEAYGMGRSPRGSLVPDPGRSPRNSLVPEPSRSPRNSLVPEVSRSPRHSLVPDPSALSPRNSLVPLDGPGSGYSRSPRASLVPGSRAATSLMPENGLVGRSPRHSLVPEPSRSPRGSVANIEYDRSPRGSICPEPNRSPRGSIVPLDIQQKERSPRGSIASECMNQSPRGSIVPEMSNRSPRGSIAPDRSPRGSLGGHRGSLGEDELAMRTSPRGSIGPATELERSPRGSLAGQDRRLPMPGYTGQDPRRSSADQGSANNRSISPYRQRGEISSSMRSAGSGVGQVNLGYGTTANTWGDSRRGSSSVSQFSGDESRRLCGGNASVAEKGGGGSGPGGGPMGVAAYGSLVFQLKDAHLEASGVCDFVYRGLRVLSKTSLVTVFLALLSLMPIVMLILGVQFMRDCPREPNIPLYMVVGGTLGGVRLFWTLYSQVRSRRPEVLSAPDSRTHITPKSLASALLWCFLAGWFTLGNYWILSIRWPEYAPKLFEPNRWCHKTLYVFALMHLSIVYAAIFAGVLTGLGLMFCRILACPWPERYK